MPLNTVIEPPALLLTWLNPRGLLRLCLSSVIFRRAAGLRLGGFDDGFRSLFEDIAFLSKMWLEERTFVADACWDRRREHPQSLVWVAGLDGKGWYALFRSFLAWLELYLRRHGWRGSDVWVALQQTLWPLRHPVLFRIRTLPRAIARRIFPRRAAASRA